MKFDVSVEIFRPAETVWSVLVDIERWPEWTPSITHIERLDQAAFGPGSSVRISQPKLKTAVWRVTEFRQGRLFTWETRSAGVSTIARHIIQPTERGCIVTHAIEQRGWLAPILRPFLMGLIRRYVQTEAQGLKRRCEDLGVVTRN